MSESTAENEAQNYYTLLFDQQPTNDFCKKAPKWYISFHFSSPTFRWKVNKEIHNTIWIHVGDILKPI